MSILHCDLQNPRVPFDDTKYQERFKRDFKEDLKEMIDMAFEFKSKMESYHPVVTDLCRRIMT
jgi:hypothetical protein